jgi:hypothetical protein
MAAAIPAGQAWQYCENLSKKIWYLEHRVEKLEKEVERLKRRRKS